MTLKLRFLLPMVSYPRTKTHWRGALSPSRSRSPRTGNSKAHSQSEASRRCTWSRALSRTGPTRNKRPIHKANGLLLVVAEREAFRSRSQSATPRSRARDPLRFFTAAFLIPWGAHVPRRTFPRVAGNPTARSVPRHPPVSAHRRYPGGGARWARADVLRSGARRGNGMGNDDDNGARRNRSEPNASALGIELTEQASSSGQLTPTLTGRATPRYRGDEERATAGESASPSRGSRKHQRARQQHHRVGQIIPTYPLAPRERARRTVR